MKNGFEYINYSDEDRLAMLETRAARIEQLLGTAPDEPGCQEDTGGAWAAGRAGDPEPRQAGQVPDYAAAAIAYYPPDDGTDGDPEAAWCPGMTGSPRHFRPAGPLAPGESGEPGEPGEAGGGEPGGRTGELISRGRRTARRGRLSRLRAHWKALAVVTAALAVLGAVVSAAGTSPGPGWPASVQAMRNEIAVACENPDVAAEPTQVNFACARGTQRVLWVFALLTSGGNPGYVDPQTGRKGLEPITPGQGGDLAWSLNLHAPYNPASAIDSLEVAARAINNIIGGATLTSADGAPLVEGGLESSAANCERYTGSAALLRRPGYPALCERPVSSPQGEQALVTDAFRQWMAGAPGQLATDAGVLFASAGDPASPRVRQILGSLPGSGM
jgi:hypothetical protein